MAPVIDAIRQHFQPAEIALRQVSCTGGVVITSKENSGSNTNSTNGGKQQLLMNSGSMLTGDGPLESVLRKTYQSNWKDISK